jgi:hypothetical protein
MAMMDDPNDPNPRKRALLDALSPDAATDPMQSTLPVGPKTELPDVAASPAAPAPAAPALDFSRLGGYDEGKFNANKQDAKYQMGRTFAQFDPRQGITPDVLKALNGLGYGTFSGSGDKLSLSGLTDTGRQNGLVGDYKDADFIGGFKSGNGKWGYADPAYEAMHPDAAQGGGGAPMGGGLPSFGGYALDSALSGDALAKIQQALAQFSNRPQLDALLQQLGS